MHVGVDVVLALLQIKLLANSKESTSQAKIS